MNGAPSFVQVNPSYVMPEMILQWAQASGAFELLAGGDPMVRLGEGDLYVYIKKLDVRTKVSAGQSAANLLPSCSIIATEISIPTYLIRTRAEYDHHDTAAASRWGYSIVEAQRLGMRQGTFQQMRTGLLYGFSPANGEGLLNTTGATTAVLPADSFGNTTVTTYDNGQMAIYLLTQIQLAKTRTLQMGQPSRIVICGSQQTLGAFEIQGIVQLTSFQRPGAGSTSVAGMVTSVLEENKDSLEWVYDDTLIGKGQGGTDAVVICIPELVVQRRAKINTNEWATKLKPGLDATTLQLCDMAAPREIPTPLSGGAIDVVSELRITPGWAIRPEAITIISMPYS
jgi:hypothetical protein